MGHQESGGTGLAALRAMPTLYDPDTEDRRPDHEREPEFEPRGYDEDDD